MANFPAQNTANWRQPLLDWLREAHNDDGSLKEEAIETIVEAMGVLTDSLVSTAGLAFVLDQDNFSSNSDTKVPTQQSVKAYVDSGLSGKANTSHTHSIANVTNLQTTLDGKSATSHTHTVTGAIQFDIGDGIVVIGTGQKGEIQLPAGCTPTKWILVSDVSTSCTLELWKSTYASYPPVSGGAVTGTGSQRPNISSNTKNNSSTLTGWTTSWSAEDYLRLNVVSNTSAKKLKLVVIYTRTV